MKRGLKQKDLTQWIKKPRTDSVAPRIDLIPGTPISVQVGDNVEIKASVTGDLQGPVVVDWQRVEEGRTTNLILNTATHHGSSSDVTDLKLIINNVDLNDAGDYQIEIRSLTKTVQSKTVRLTVYEDDKSLLSKEESNFLRIYILCQKLGTEAVQLLFDRYVPPGDLSGHLRNHRTDLERGNPRKQIQKCDPHQLQTLFKANPGVVISSTKFDLTLLYKLIRSTVKLISPPTRGWGREPLSCDTLEADDLERINKSRNDIVHNTNLIKTEAEFKLSWDEISEAIKRISKGLLTQKINDLFKRQFSMKQKDEIMNSIDEINKNLKKQNQDIQDLKGKIQEMVVTHIPPNIRRSQQQQIATWRNEDQIFFSETAVCNAAWDVVSSKRVITFVGRPGSGKSATARHLGIRLEKEGYEVIPVCKLDKVLEFVNVDIKQVFLLDDVLGKFYMDMSLYNNAENHKYGLMNGIGKFSKILFTCRKTVFNQAKTLDSFITENYIDFQSRENILTENDKSKMLRLHCLNKHFREEDFTNISLKSADFMFPLLCKLFSNDISYQKQGETFFNHPIKCLLDEIDKLSKVEYAALIMCLVKGGGLSIDTLPLHEAKIDIFNTCGANLGTSDREIVLALETMEGTYLRKTKHVFKFLHDSIFEVAAYHYGVQFPDQILKYFPSSYIANKVKICSTLTSRNDAGEMKNSRLYLTTNDLTITLGIDRYSFLAERLYSDVTSLALYDVFMNPVLKDRTFLDKFKEVFSSKPYDDIRELIFVSKDKNWEHVYNRSKSIENKSIVPELWTEADRQLLLLNFTDWSLDDFDNDDFDLDWCHSHIRIISWIIYYGHEKLLEIIMDLADTCKNKCSLAQELFNSDISEQSRLLTLACFSKNVNIVEMVLKYANNDCINNNCYDNWMCDDDPENRHRLCTPIHAACQTGNIDILNLLLDRNGNVNINYRSEWPPFFLTVANGDLKIVQHLFERATTEILNHALLLAASKGYYEIVQFLVEKGIDFNFSQQNTGISPIMAASRYGHFEVAKYLIEQGADFNKVDEENDSSFLMSSRYGHFDIVQYLLAKEVDINLVNVQKRSALLEAISGGYSSIAKLLIDHGSDVNLHDIMENSPLSEAIQNDDFDIVKLLIDKGVDINAQSDPDMSPFFQAVCHGRNDIVDLLLANGAETTKTYEDTATPMQMALWGNQLTVIRKILKSENERIIFSGNHNLFDLLTEISKEFLPIRGHDRLNHQTCWLFPVSWFQTKMNLVTFIMWTTNQNLLRLLHIGLNPNARYNPLPRCFCYNCKQGKRHLLQILVDPYNTCNVYEREDKILSLLTNGADLNVKCLRSRSHDVLGKYSSLLEYSREDIEIEGEYGVPFPYPSTTLLLAKHSRRHSI